MYTVLAHLTDKNFKGFKYLTKLFPLHHNTISSTSASSTPAESPPESRSTAHVEEPFLLDDAHQIESELDTAGTRTDPTVPSATRVHVEKPYFYNEQSTLDMVEILKKMVTRYLELLGNLVENKDEFQDMVKTVRDPKSNIESRREAEAYIKEQSQVHGEMIIQGDQLTVARIESAKRLQKGSLTMLGRLDLVQVVMTGMFHADMNRVIYDYQALLDMESDEPGTLGRLKLATRWNHISNAPDVIKSCGKFEDHRQFLDGVGTQYLLEAIGNTLKEIVEDGQVIEETEEGAIRLFEKILEDNKIKLFQEPNTSNVTSNLSEPSTAEHYDDLAKYASDISSRTLLSLVMRQAERQGDFEAIIALKIVLVTFFFNVSGLNSNYAPTLMFDIVDYLGASSATKKRMEAMATANLSGKAGHNIHVDKMCEQFIREVKAILTNLHRAFSDALIDTVIAASNPFR